MGNWATHRPEIAEKARQRGDSAFSEKFVDVPRYLSSWTEDIGYLEGKRVLDFGCGSGEAACGTALFHNAEVVLGVDSGKCAGDLRERIGRFTDLENLPSNVSFRQISLADGLNEGEFDFIYSWSFFLRLPPKFLPAVVSKLYHRLALGGRILIQLSPLYYSPNGAQLAEYGLGAWEHLLLPHAEVRARVFDTRHSREDKRSAAWTCYESLNRVGAADISKLFCESGFHQVRYYETRLNIPAPRVLHESFREDTLTREQVVFLFSKT